MKRYGLMLTVCFAVTATGCAGRKSARGFSLPDGDPAQGEATFVALQCHACHNVSGVTLPELEYEPETPIHLGGQVSRLKTYGELVTSIINPSHRIAKGYAKELVEQDGQSKMKDYNDVLTVSQLIDLVAFLEDHYELEEYDPTEYPIL
jgi:hypothetical protein